MMGHAPILGCLALFRKPLSDVATQKYLNLSIGPTDMVSTQQLVAETCRHALANEDYFEYVRERSYRHDNGFDKIVIHQGDEDVAEARLHIWRPGSIPSGETNVHDHTAHFASLVICGRLEETIFEEALDPSGEPFDEYVYSSRGEQSHYGMRFVRRAWLKRCRKVQLGSGLLHAVRDDVLHSSNIPEEDAVTLFCQGRRTRREVRVLSSVKHVWPEVVHSPTFTRDELRQVLAQALELISTPRT